MKFRNDVEMADREPDTTPLEPKLLEIELEYKNHCPCSAKLGN